MLKQWCGCFFLVTLVSVLGLYAPDHQALNLSPEMANQMGLQIWKNECGGKLEGLTTWNKGEDFASLGIGHFIWYPTNKQGIFKETFPDLLAFFKSYGVQLPAWLEQAKGCPWETKEEFEQARFEETQEELRQLLAQHIDLQILFMVQRLNKALPTLLNHTSQDKHSHLTFQFYRLAYTPAGLYALIDYLNFKGEGIVTQESYQGQSWGLLQILEQLEGTEPGYAAIEEFIAVAKKILLLRVEHAPIERQEKRWLKGWYNRLETYSHFSFKTSNQN